LGVKGELLAYELLEIAQRYVVILEV